MNSNDKTLIGTWKLISCVLEDAETKEQKPVWGTNPNGYIVMTPEAVPSRNAGSKDSRNERHRNRKIRHGQCQCGLDSVEHHRLAIEESRSGP